MARRRLIVVSNRGPVVYRRDETGELVARRGGGGLVTALDSLAAAHDVTWVASALSDGDRAVASAAEGAIEERSRGGSAFRLRLVDHPRAEYERYYSVVANPMLWFVQHRLWDLARAPTVDERFRAAWDDGYVPVNRRFAEMVLGELRGDPSATVFFHDYHLYLAPRDVRTTAPEARLAHFVHIPWVGHGGWDVLPADLRRAIHDGLLANDLVGFHTERWRSAFADSARSLLGAETTSDRIRWQGRETLTVARPISVDPDEFATFATSPAVRERQQMIRTNRHEQIVLRVDRTDPSKNILRGFEAFARLLEDHPEHRGRVRLVALLDPSRQDIPEYEGYTRDVAAAAEAVRRRLGEDAVQVRIEDDFPLTVAGYKEFDVLLVNPVADGLNLVAKEGPLVNERAGVLVLSEGAGAAEELAEWALVVNPFDVGEQAAALHRALVMPEAERRARLEGIRDHVRRHDVAAWGASLLADLDAVASRPQG